jgi:flavin-binding protein dodecin
VDFAPYRSAWAPALRLLPAVRWLRWFEVMRTSGHIDNGKVRHYHVTLSVCFTMEEPR